VTFINLNPSSVARRRAFRVRFPAPPMKLVGAGGGS
jgi:N-methylhydantoinase A/oxoprolinase/acetone carboxylase beta subunit